jgi:hypothetical protein
MQVPELPHRNHPLHPSRLDRSNQQQPWRRTQGEREEDHKEEDEELSVHGTKLLYELEFSVSSPLPHLTLKTWSPPWDFWQIRGIAFFPNGWWSFLPRLGQKISMDQQHHWGRMRWEENKGRSQRAMAPSGCEKRGGRAILDEIMRVHAGQKRKHCDFFSTPITT